MRQFSWQWWVRLVCALLGVLGLAVAITAVVVALPSPAAGGTCGPGKLSESPIAAFFDPVSIGAGTEPPASDTLDRLYWAAFVSECQSSTDARILLALAVLDLAVLVTAGGFLLTRTRPSETAEATTTTSSEPTAAGGPPAGWYWDPSAPTAPPRWWTGGSWGPAYHGSQAPPPP